MSGEFESWLRNDERREELRLSAVCTVHIDFPELDPGLDGERYTPCPTIDFSTNGVQVEAIASLEQGSIHQVVVAVNGEVFALVAEVMWCRPALDGKFLLGLHLLDSDDSAVIEWKEAMIKWLNG